MLQIKAENTISDLSADTHTCLQYIESDFMFPKVKLHGVYGERAAVEMEDEFVEM